MREYPPPTIGGIDFGYHNPFCALWGHVDHDGVLWITGCRYKAQTTLPQHSESIPRGVRYWCDPSGASDIRELRMAGHDAVPCLHRGTMGLAGTPRRPVLSGIDRVSDRMRTGRLKIVRRACLPLINELSSYHYDPEKKSEDPIKEDDHACDALRYMVVGLDRGRAIPSTIQQESDEQLAVRLRAERDVEFRARREEEERIRNDPNIWDERRWGQ